MRDRKNRRLEAKEEWKKSGKKVSFTEYWREKNKWKD